jgi:hypothetical protein
LISPPSFFFVYRPLFSLYLNPPSPSFILYLCVIQITFVATAVDGKRKRVRVTKEEIKNVFPPETTQYYIEEVEKFREVTKELWSVHNEHD